MESNYFDIAFFEPTREEMLKRYPELNDYPEIAALTEREIRFCWALGCKTSPFLLEDDKEKRYKKAYDYAFSSMRRKDDYAGIRKGDVPMKLIKGIEKFQGFLIGNRLEAYLMLQHSIVMFRKMSIVADKDLKDMDADEMKKLVDITVKISEELPKMITRMETQYGLNHERFDRSSGKAKVLVSVSNLNL